VSWALILAAGLAQTAARAQDTGTLDTARAAWRYRRTVELPAPMSVPGGAPAAFVAVPIDPEVATLSRLDLRDIRLVDAEGREVPYVVNRRDELVAERRAAGRLVEVQRQPRARTTWVVDLGAPATFDRLELSIDGLGFAKRFRVETSDDGQTWAGALDEAWVFDREWRGRRLRDTTIELAAPVTARFLRLDADDFRSRPVDVSAMVVTSRRLIDEAFWTREVSLDLIDTDGPRTQYRVAVADGFPMSRLTFDTDDAAFWRQVTVLERRIVSGVLRETSAGQGSIYRLRLDDEPLDAESRTIEVSRTLGGELLVDIVNDDAPPLANPRATVGGPEVRLLVAPGRSPLVLYYGNTVTRAPVYDLQYLAIRLSIHAEYPVATVGAAAENPRFAQPPPLAFLPERGASVDASRWRAARRLDVSGDEDVYTMLLTPADVSYLRADAADLRVVDEADRQVPYVIEPRASRRPVTLSIARTSGDGATTGRSSYRLALDEAQSGLAVRGLELEFAERFFNRPATIFVGSPADRQRRLRYPVTLASERPDDQASPVRVELSAADVREIELVVEDGDNAPLSLTGARALVDVPRVTFKAQPGTYRLLLGNPDAEAPRYDLAALRQEVLAYSAVPLAIDEERAPQVNPAFRRRLGDFAREAPPTPVLWATLGAAVLALLYLTRRALRQPAAGEPGGTSRPGGSPEPPADGPDENAHNE
jgi:hypothetical protein